MSQESLTGVEAATVSAKQAESFHEDDAVRNLPEPENRVFYPALDGLRAVAVLMVFFEHYALQPPALDWGWAGVDIFFVLSGFLITGILFDTRDSVHRYRSFYARRALRIFPLYYGVLLIALALTPIFRWDWRPTHLLLPFYLSNYARVFGYQAWLQHSMAIDHISSLRYPAAVFATGHFWSLAVEEQFYLVWPMVVFAVRSRRALRNLCLAAAFASLTVRTAGLLWLPQHSALTQLPILVSPLRGEGLFVGAALAMLLRGPEGQALLRHGSKLLLALVTMFVAAEVVCFRILHRLIDVEVDHLGVQSIGFSFVCWTAAAVVLLALKPDTAVFRLLTLRLLRRLGQMSYGFYVFHDVPHVAYQWMAIKLSHGTVADFDGRIMIALAFTGTMLLSVLSYRYYESPFLRLKKRFAAT